MTCTQNLCLNDKNKTLRRFLLSDIFCGLLFFFFFRKDQTKTRKIVTHQNILRKETGAQLDSLAAFVNLISTIKQRNSFDINENKGIRKLVSFELRKKNPRLCAGIMFNLATCFTLF